MDQAKPTLQGIKGWLLFVGVLITLETLLSLARMPANFKNLFDNHYQGLYGMMLLEFSYNGAVCLASLLMVFLFFSKKRSFPNLFIAMQIVPALYYIAFSILFQSLVRSPDQYDLFDIVALLKLVMSPLILIPYMRKSARVRHTFVA